MATQNDRTVPSPERDEELEKFIENEIEMMDFHFGVGSVAVKEACEKVAAFSRKKAIQECYLLACCKASHSEGSTCGVDCVLEELFDGESVESILDGHQIPQDVMKDFRIWTSMEGIKELIDKNIKSPTN